MWSKLTFLIISAAIFALACGFALWVRNYNKKKAIATHGVQKFPIPALAIMTVGVFLSAVLLIYPSVHTDIGDNTFIAYVSSALASAQNALKFFTIDADFSIITALFAEGERDDAVYRCYLILSALLHVIAPLLSAGVVLSFFKNAKAFCRYYFSRPSDMYFLSELNERSFALAEDIFAQYRKDKKRVKVIFTDVFEQKDDEKSYELVSRARGIGCILFARDITELRLRWAFGKRVKRVLYFIGINEDENLRQALSVITACRKSRFIGKGKDKIEKKSVYNTPNTEFYVFSRSAESEALLNSIDNGDMKVRRIDENRNFVLRTLMKYPIFDDALPPEEGKTEKRLNILLVGLGMIGTEFVKALSWVGQMYGYVLNLHIFDGESDIEKRLRTICPELIDNNFASRRSKRDDETLTAYYNDKSGISYKERIDGDAYYNFFYYDGINVKTQEFLDIVAGIGPLSTVYVTLGDDELNIETAMRLRTMLQRSAIDFGEENRPIPSIYAVVYSTIKNEIIANHNGLKVIKNVDYGIKIIGSLESSFTVRAIRQQNIEDAGLECHEKWANSNEDRIKSKISYAKYEYFRRSSMAEAMHGYLRKKIGLMPSIVDEETKKQIFKHEHCRWCAFVRSEGYVARAKRDDLAKTHNNLRPYDELRDDVRLLDEIVLTEIIGNDEE